MTGLHRFDPTMAELGFGWVRDRLTGGAPLGRTASAAELRAALPEPSLTGSGIGLDEAWRRFAEVLAPATIGLDSPRFLAFVPAAPSPAAVLMDAVVSAASFSGESWLEAAGAVHAENETLELIARLAGFPSGAGGCFVSGGSAGNLSALAVARAERPGRNAVAVADTAHASIANAAALLGLELVVVESDERGRLLGERLERLLAHDERIGIVVASAGSTNSGAIDELEPIAAACRRHDAWLHVDGAYGAAALLVDATRPRFEGLQHAESLIVDPHKWLFAPLGSCALLYRSPAEARAVHTQQASYLDALHLDEAWNPADHAFQLTRRASGLPLWFALAVHGIDAHAEAIAHGIELARLAARWVRERGAPLELVMEPDLSVVLFRRHGWNDTDWAVWSRRLLTDGVAFVTPTRWKGETVGRLVFLHPATPPTLIEEILASASATQGSAEPGDG